MNLNLHSNIAAIMQSRLMNLTNGRCRKRLWVERAKFIFPFCPEIFSEHLLQHKHTYTTILAANGWPANGWPVEGSGASGYSANTVPEMKAWPAHHSSNQNGYSTQRGQKWCFCQASKSVFVTFTLTSWPSKNWSVHALARGPRVPTGVKIGSTISRSLVTDKWTNIKTDEPTRK